ncbi:MAG: type IX secretion system membrane protein PorP/SprF [Flavobacteriales bacterium]
MADFNDDIKNIFDGADIPFNPEHWEQMKERLNQSPASSPFEEKAKDIFESAAVTPPAGAWEQFEQKLNEAQSTPFEKSIQDKFADAEVTYNESHWESISNKINSSSGFDKKVRDIFNAAETPYNAKHWEQMEAMLDASGKKPAFFNWKYAAASAAMLLMGWLAYAALSDNKENSTAENSGVSDAKQNVAKNEQQQNTSYNNTTELSASAENTTTSSKEALVEPSVKSKESNIAHSKKKNRKNKNSANASVQHSYNEEGTALGEVVAVNNNNSSENSTLNVASHTGKIALRELTIVNKDFVFEAAQGVDTLATTTVDADWSGQIFKYATLPSSLPSSVLANIWEQPAIAGIDQKTAVKFMYNSPWENRIIDRSNNAKEFHLLEPAHMFLSADAAPFRNKNIGVGGYYQRIHNNDWQSDNINLSLSYTHAINKFTQVRGGIGATYCNNALNTNNLNFWENTDNGAMLVANDESVNNPERYINYKAGVWLNHPLVFAGVTLDNLFQVTLTKKPDLQLGSSAIAGVNIPFTKKFTTTIYGKRISSLKALYTGGLIFSYNNQWFTGASFENSNYAAITMGCNIKDQLRLHLSWGISADKESLYIDESNRGFITAGVRYLIEPSSKSSGLAQ